MSFHSILFRDADAEARALQSDAAALTDLRLDTILNTLLEKREEYDLLELFHRPLPDLPAVGYRQEIFRDIQQYPIRDALRRFAADMRTVRGYLATAQKLHYARQQQRWCLDAAAMYCDAIETLAADLRQAEPRSEGLANWRDHLLAHVHADEFGTLRAENLAVREALAVTRYTVRIEGTRVHVGRYSAEADYATEVLQTFAKFAEGATRDYRFASQAEIHMNHVQAAILDLVALLHPEPFVMLENYCRKHANFVDAAIRRFDREVQFYLGILDYFDRRLRQGLPYCLPEMALQCTETYARDLYDTALSDRLMAEHATVVSNDFELHGPERILVVSGPNQGGKTTFARSIGQLHYLASLGCPVPARSARLMLVNRLCTVFEREEHLENRSGKLEEELLRVHAILQQAGVHSLLIMNETLSATTLADALLLGQRVLRQILERHLLCVYVTFLEELASFSSSTVSMVSMVDAADPALRTFKVVRRAADGKAYALSVAHKYRLTHDQIRERLTS